MVKIAISEGQYAVRNGRMTEHNVKVDEIQGFSNGFVLLWSGDCGFGEYTIYTDEDGKIKGDSECMDRGEKKTFLEQLFASIVEQIKIT